MKFKYNATTDELDIDDSSLILVVSSTPASGFNGQLILDSSSSTIKVWWSSQWQIIATLTAPVSSGPLGISLGLANL